MTKSQKFDAQEAFVPESRGYVDELDRGEDPLGIFDETDPLFATHYNMADYFVDPAGTAAAREYNGLAPIDPEEFDNWLNELPEEVREELEIDRQNTQKLKERRKMVHERLTSQVPELYGARLPESIESKLDGTQYAIGFNQSMGISTGDEAIDYLMLNGGVDVSRYNIHHRFQIIDKHMGEEYLGADIGTSAARNIEAGYTNNPFVGRFVAVFPIAHPENAAEGLSLSQQAGFNPHVLPEDLEVSSMSDGEERSVVTSKYIAGFIDEVGVFWENTGFMEDTEANLFPFEPDQETTSLSDNEV